MPGIIIALVSQDLPQAIIRSGGLTDRDTEAFFQEGLMGCDPIAHSHLAVVGLGEDKSVPADNELAERKSLVQPVAFQ